MSQNDKKKWAQEVRRSSTTASRAATSNRRRKKRRRRLSKRGKIIVTGMLIACIAILIGLVLLVRAAVIGISHAVAKSRANRVQVEQMEEIESTASEPETEAPVVEDKPEVITSFQPTCTPDTDPKNLIETTSIEVNGTVLDDIESYVPSHQISFETGDKYTQMDGVITFRGNNFRNSPAYGLANMTENKLETVWSQTTGSTTYKGKTWNGSGWTGQPLITTWSREVRQHMNMYDWAKEQDELTEVIYATLDGNVYFLELLTGKPTRDPLKIGFTFKGAGALDPRGYPIMYLGSGYNSSKGQSRVFVVNLLDCSIMYTFGNNDEFARRSVPFFDSSALVDAETDTLIYPGENGILYLIHLNTKYDEAAGTLSVEPDRTVKWNYWGTRTTKSKYWVGMETSAVIYQGYLFVADNGANLMCLDLNTLKLVWVQDTLDDTNGSPVMSVEDGHPYIYISTSFHKGWRANNKVNIPIFKIDAENGAIVWQTEYDCTTVEDVSGGVQSTIALGKKGLEDYIYCTVSRTPDDALGVLTCLNKKTGEIVWEHKARYAWSSPVCVYNSDGSGNVIYADSSGKLYLIDGITGSELDAVSISDGVVEASPAVYNDMLIVGIRASKIWGVKLK